MQEHEPACGRENDLVAFLYNELSDTEKRSFESHMHSCSSCRIQGSEFRSIRGSLVAWRDESLGQSAIAVPGTIIVPNQSKGSALAALRAFFDLSPLWMKGAVTFAALLFCVLSALAVFQLGSAPTITTPTANNQQYSTQELNALVEARVKYELARRAAVDQPAPPLPSHSAVNEKTGRTASPGLVNRIAVARNARNATPRRPLSRAEREELATDLRLLSSANERGLDLIGDQNQ